MTVPNGRIPLLEHAFAFLRHGETQSNIDGTIAGWSDVPLTERGREQAHAAATMLAGKGITAIYTSALRRARETAECVAQATSLPVTIVPELAERCWGEIEGKPRSLRRPGVTPPGAETIEAFTARIRRGLGRIKPDGFPLIVSHSGVFRALCTMLRIPESQDRLPNAQPVEFVPADRESDGGWQLTRI
jgi:probable phosphoglycerate mutase